MTRWLRWMFVFFALYLAWINQSQAAGSCQGLFQWKESRSAEVAQLFSALRGQQNHFLSTEIRTPENSVAVARIEEKAQALRDGRGGSEYERWIFSHLREPLEALLQQCQKVRETGFLQGPTLNLVADFSVLQGLPAQVVLRSRSHEREMDHHWAARDFSEYSKSLKAGDPELFDSLNRALAQLPMTLSGERANVARIPNSSDSPLSRVVLTASDLGFVDLVEARGEGFVFVQVPTKPYYFFDGQFGTSHTFFRHDLSHWSTQAREDRRVWSRLLGAKEWTVPRVQKEVSSFHRKLLTDVQKIDSERDRAAALLVLFFSFHEEGRGGLSLLDPIGAYRPVDVGAVETLVRRELNDPYYRALLLPDPVTATALRDLDRTLHKAEAWVRERVSRLLQEYPADFIRASRGVP